VTPAIDPEVRTATAHGLARVLVELRVSDRPSPAPDAASQARAIAAAQQEVLARLAGVPYRLVRQYTSVPLLALEIGGAALRALEAMGDVVARVRADRLRSPGAPG
jgi:hypothetical protein